MKFVKSLKVYTLDLQMLEVGVKLIKVMMVK